MTIMRMISKAGSMTAPHPQQQKQLPHASCQPHTAGLILHYLKLLGPLTMSSTQWTAQCTMKALYERGKTNGWYYPNQKVFHIPSQSTNCYDSAHPEQKHQDDHHLQSGSVALRKDPINKKYQQLKQSLTSSEVPCHTTSVPPRFWTVEEKFLLNAKEKKSEQVVSFLSGTFPPAHLLSAQSLSKFSGSPCLALSLGNTRSCWVSGRFPQPFASATAVESQTRSCQLGED